jgi:type II secretory pathway pseudopilin PulG
MERDNAEAGYVLLAVIFLTVILLVTLAIAAPKIASQIQRDRDVETIHRGEQYKRAIQEYYKTFGAYPTSFDQLKQTNNIRFLRKEYADPLTGKVDWKPVYYGQAHVRPLGFFGQPLSAVAGVGAASMVMGGASAGMYAVSSTTTTTDENGIPVAADSDSGSGSGSGPGMSSGSDSGFGSGSGSGFGSGSSSGLGSTGGSGLSSGGLGQSGSGIGSSGTGLSGLQSSGSTPGGSSGFGGSNSTSASGLGGSTFGGGGPIVGVTLPVNKPSLVDYKLQSRYNKWEFNYDPMEDQMMAASSLFGGSSVDANGTGTGTNTTGSGFGNSNSGFGNGGTGLGGSNNGSGLGGSGLGGSNPNGSGGNGGTNPPSGSSSPQ